MKKIVIAIMLIFVHVNADDTNDFFFNRGYQKGFDEGFRAGERKAFEKAKEIINKYKANIKSYEIGKYLLKENKLTYPKVWQKITQDGIQIVVQPSRIIDQLNVNDIFMKFGNIPTIVNSKDTEKENKYSSGVNIATRDNIVNLPSRVGKDSRIITINVEKNWKNEQILKKANATYSVDKKYFKIMFFTKTEKNSFCKNYRICR